MLKIKKTALLILIALCFTNMQCDEDALVVDVDNSCDEVVILNKALYGSLVSDDFNFIDVEIVDDCLNIKIGASGCDGATWACNLVSSEAIAQSLPEQRNLKFELVNNEDCDAYFEKTISFNLKPLQISNSVNKVVLHLNGWESSLLYSY
ncbi:hypothetical protein [Jejuia pallidilutea]|uniref:Uncharacterized protein n=1 Tax=Jejuia pallidilutea TaxID=504487 RepID=A0A098LVU3_9FLAO|nr:hypothetical protein [Jejuia pallidilutea]GAL90398.1 hypothetical protein JCM19538_163 [Jejuia pallidilutea]